MFSLLIHSVTIVNSNTAAAMQLVEGFDTEYDAKLVGSIIAEKITKEMKPDGTQVICVVFQKS